MTPSVRTFRAFCAYEWHAIVAQYTFTHARLSGVVDPRARPDALNARASQVAPEIRKASKNDA
jgi:hypothetical protein